MTKVDQAHARDGMGKLRISGFHKRRHGRHRHRNVVFDVQALLRLRQRNAFADLPQGLGLGQTPGHHGVGDTTLRKRHFKQAFKLLSGMGFRLGIGVFQQHTESAVRIQRHAQGGKVFGHQAQGKLAHHFKTGQAGAQVLLRQTEQHHGRFQRGHSRPGRQLRLGQRIKLERGSGDDAQCALGSDVEVLQVITGVVLAQAAQALPHVALRRDHLQPQAQLTRIAKTQHLGAAGIGAQCAADGASAFGRQTQRVPETRCLG